MLSLAIAIVLAAPEAERVVSFPKYGQPKAPHYSGFLNASAAEPSFLHYWFAAYTGGDGKWTEKPVVLWLNGGPVASSLLGMLQELGPLIIDSAGGLVENPYAWTEVANVIALESPAGVGYSYCVDVKSQCESGDASTAEQNHEALLAFLGRFPEYRSRSLYLTGESYAGVYLPTLMEQILSRGQIRNVEGLAIGNGCWGTA